MDDANLGAVIVTRTRTSAALAASLSLTIVAGAVPSTALAQPAGDTTIPEAPAPAPAASDPKEAVLGLEGEDAAAAVVLTGALRESLAKHGIGGGPELPLVELKLTMGCESADSDCLRSGGETLGVAALVYGTLHTDGSGYRLDLQQLNVADGKVAAKASLTLTPADLEGDRLEHSAEVIAATLLGKPIPAAPADPNAPVAEAPAPEPAPVADAPRGRVVFGVKKPTPNWKWIGLGTSGGLTLVALTTAIVSTIRLNGALRDDLLSAAENSLTDGKASNDVDPNSERDLCELGREHPPSDTQNPNSVRNAAVTTVCNKADTTAAIATASWIGTGVFAASSLVFAGLTFLHKETPAATALHRRGIQVGGAPRPEGGFSIGVQGRF